MVNSANGLQLRFEHLVFRKSGCTHLLHGSNTKAIRLNAQHILIPLKLCKEPLKVTRLVLRQQEGHLSPHIHLHLRS